ncbi:MAG: hypothetical protein A2Y62_04925 [Candidatus Fischerbacteria bacterium RBG_13_37_8]|uniref:Sulfatase N-terminal domain-containing protein n=1 Tax=Candidatus Fischerbacteria bacterium RBG_13_37_8 TaxID=1817863 RepID=A0A1F5VHU5_9BACT|nr:MAG: hypothetical protein A2Y62_04925 [Candidatus Fischerbacteria bacterium RBG_13_37_8]
MPHKNKIILFLSVLTIVVLYLFIACHGSKPVVKPNIVLIVVDALRPDHLSFYGYEKNSVPFMAELAAKGVVFQHAYSTSSWTAPATSSILTSLYPFQHGVTMGLAAHKQLIEKDSTIQITRLPEIITTLPEMLKEAGYQTYAITANPNISEVMGLGQGFDSLLIPRATSAKGIYRNCLGISKTLNKNKPYFLYLHFMDTHSPYRIKLPENLRTGDNRKDRITIYDIELKFIDTTIKKIFQEFGWDKNTLIIITADHGEEHFDHGKTGHGYSLYHEVLKVPLMLYYPGVFPAGKRIKQNVSTIDLFPTIAHLISVSPPEYIAGINLLPLINQKSERLLKRCLFAHLKLIQNDLTSRTIVSVICDDYHYIQYPKQKMLFDLALDPKETRNIIKEKRFVAKKLASAYFTYFQKCKKFSIEKTSTVLNQKQIEELKSLGYIK